MIAVDRRDDRTNLCRFREDKGDVCVIRIRKHEVRGVTQSVTVSGERPAGRIVSLDSGWLAQVWAPTPEGQTGGRTHAFKKLGVFPDRQQAVEAIARAFDTRDNRMLKVG